MPTVAALARDTRVSRSMSMQQEAIQVYTDWRRDGVMRPIFAVGKPTIDKYIAEQPKLQNTSSTS